MRIFTWSLLLPIELAHGNANPSHRRPGRVRKLNRQWSYYDRNSLLKSTDVARPLLFKLNIMIVHYHITAQSLCVASALWFLSHRRLHFHRFHQLWHNPLTISNNSSVCIPVAMSPCSGADLGKLLPMARVQQGLFKMMRANSPQTMAKGHSIWQFQISASRHQRTRGKRRSSG